MADNGAPFAFPGWDQLVPGMASNGDMSPAMAVRFSWIT
jgi:hypothetical protein